MDYLKKDTCDSVDISITYRQRKKKGICKPMVLYLWESNSVSKMPLNFEKQFSAVSVIIKRKLYY